MCGTCLACLRIESSVSLLTICHVVCQALCCTFDVHFVPSSVECRECHAYSSFRFVWQVLAHDITRRARLSPNFCESNLIRTKRPGSHISPWHAHLIVARLGFLLFASRLSCCYLARVLACIFAASCTCELVFVECKRPILTNLFGFCLRAGAPLHPNAQLCTS